MANYYYLPHQMLCSLANKPPPPQVVTSSSSSLGPFLPHQLFAAAKAREGRVCAVCLDDLIGGHDRKTETLDCRHVFHVSCITKWLSNKNICPLCRAVASAPPQRH